MQQAYSGAGPQGHVLGAGHGLDHGLRTVDLTWHVSSGLEMLLRLVILFRFVKIWVSTY